MTNEDKPFVPVRFAVLTVSDTRSLDDWLQLFGIQNHDRHDALADALATAQLLLVVLAAAGRQGLATWADLARLQKDQRWLGAPRR